MGTEIERRFRVQGDAWRGLAPAAVLQQGYISVDPLRTVRVRVVGEAAWLTLKSAINARSRHEFEYPIPVADAQKMLQLMCSQAIHKHRHRIPLDGHVWEVDEFFGANAGLVLAEIELSDEQQAFARPAWLGEEVTDDARYTNAYLSEHPWAQWGAATP